MGYYRIDIMLPILEGNVVEAIDVVPEVGAEAGAVHGEGFGHAVNTTKRSKKQ